MMEVRLDKPESLQFIDDQVRAGSFPTHQAVVEYAIERLRDEMDVELTAEDAQAIAESDEQIARGEVVEFKDFAARMRAKYGIAQ